PVRPASGDRHCCSSPPPSAAPTSSTTCRWNSEIHRGILRSTGRQHLGRPPGSPVTACRPIPEHKRAALIWDCDEYMNFLLTHSNIRMQTNPLFLDNCGFGNSASVAEPLF